LGVLQRSTDAKVTDGHDLLARGLAAASTTTSDKDIRWLDIAVQDLPLVDVGQRIAELIEPAQNH
jgi:hypothetical protein